MISTDANGPSLMKEAMVFKWKMARNALFSSTCCTANKFWLKNKLTLMAKKALLKGPFRPKLAWNRIFRHGQTFSIIGCTCWKDRFHFGIFSNSHYWGGIIQISALFSKLSHNWNFFTTFLCVYLMPMDPVWWKKRWFWSEKWLEMHFLEQLALLQTNFG